MSADAFTRHALFADQVGGGLEDGFPFETVLSFASVAARWETLSAEDPATYADAWADIKRDLANVPELLEPIEDPALLDAHAGLVARLTRPLFPASAWTTDARALSAPFGGLVVARTDAYEKAFGAHTERSIDAINEHDVYMRTLYAYRAILGRFYGVDMRLDQPLVFVVPDESGDLNRYFKLNGNTRFASIEACGELPDLSPADLDRLLQNVDDLAVWREALPPALFRFLGVTVTTLTDVTHETATAAITQHVLTSDADVTEATFASIEREVRNLFRVGSLRLGLASLQADGALNLRSRRSIWNSLAVRDALREGTLDWRGTAYERALLGEVVVIPDTEAVGAPLGPHLAELGVRSLALQPLRMSERTVGVLELSSSEPGVVDASTRLKMRRIEPVFALAVFQNLERFETRVESAIQHGYTAIHPSVRWRFREAAIAMLERGTSEPPPIAFGGVHPLFGAADIRSSTRHRNEAVRHDVLARLGRARESLTRLHEALPLTLLDELRLRVERRMEEVETAWTTGDQAATEHLLTDEVEPVIERLAGGRPDLAPVLDAYRGGAGGNGKTPRSEAYETSRRAVNRCVSDVLLAEQAEAQRLFPHYFEHAKTDGVEHAMYIGASLTRDFPFDPAYVQNLRLRQLLAACAIAREVRRLHPSLQMALDVAQLIVVQHAPITLRFRADETRFDVDGAAGVRFELLKKRLDKAHVRGTDERITQPDHIAVVYSTEDEGAEYARYAEYLIANGHVEPEPEVLGVEDLPGAAGLQMLRLRVA